MTSVNEGLCGKLMPRKKTTCARRSGHQGDCRTAQALTDTRQRKTERRRGTRGALDRRKWRKAYRLSRYGITQKQFDWLLEAQQFACGMCGESFEPEQPICIDHDHACCPEEKRSCGSCVRGLLCLDCNTTLGKIERKLKMAQAYVAAPLGKMLPAA